MQRPWAQWEDRAGLSKIAKASQAPWEPEEGASDPTWVWRSSGGLPEASKGTKNVRPESGTVGWGFGHLLGLQKGEAVLSKEATQWAPPPPMKACCLTLFHQPPNESRQPMVGSGCDYLYSMDSEAKAQRKSQGQVCLSPSRQPLAQCGLTCLPCSVWDG